MGSQSSQLRITAASALFFSLATADDWRVFSASPAQGSWRLAEPEFYSDRACTQRLSAAPHSTFAAPLPKAGQAPVLHQGEDCWGKCTEGTSGPCAWCGEGNACCKHGFAGDPVECRAAVGFVSPHHECVAIAAVELPETVVCDDCAARTLVVGTAVVGDVRCVRLHGSAGSFSLEVAHRPVSPCPGLCRSGRYVEGGTLGPCTAFLSPHGWCGSGPGDRAGTDCSSCSGLAGAWGPPSLDPVPGGLWLLHEAPPPQAPPQPSPQAPPPQSPPPQAQPDAPPQAPTPQAPLHQSEDCWGKCEHPGLCDWCGKGKACCKRGFASDPPECQRAGGFTSQHHECVQLLPVSALRSPLLHEGEDCWGKCAEGGSGMCAWCGEGHACCKRGFEADPAECQRAIAFTSEHHECVRLLPRPRNIPTPSVAAGVVLVAAWLAACAGARLLFRRPAPTRKPQPLEGDVDLNWRRRTRDDAALRKELAEKAKRLHWLGFHV